MKKLFLILLLVSFLSIAGFSQISMGITGGLNMSKFNGDLDDIDQSFKMGIAGGAFAEVGLLGLSVAPEALFVMKGSKMEMYGEDLESKLTYLEVPILARYYFPSILIKPFITAGPYYSILLSAKEDDVEVNGTSINIKRDVDVKNSMESQDFGLKIGAGVKIKKLTAMVRYSMGLKATNKSGEDMKNGTIELMAAFTF